jgi:hypothetical protein
MDHQAISIHLWCNLIKVIRWCMLKSTYISSGIKSTLAVNVLIVDFKMWLLYEGFTAIVMWYKFSVHKRVVEFIPAPYYLQDPPSLLSSAKIGQCFRDGLLPPLSSPENEGSKHFWNVGQFLTDVHGGVFQKTVPFRFVNELVPGVRKWGWIVGILFIDTSAQLIPHTAAGVLIFFS